MLEAKIIAVADVIDSMSASRAYRQSLGLPAAIDEIIKNKGLLYDADVVDACCRLYEKHNTDMLNLENIWRPKNSKPT
jgi:HD-GYP domain-containing protein (c-di-GMP phosphodiesterase class II)